MSRHHVFSRASSSRFTPPPALLAVNPRPTHLKNPYKIGAQYSSLDDPKHALLQWTVTLLLSYKPRKSNDKRRYIVDCRDKACPFQLRFTWRTSGVIETTVYKPHRCSPDVHHNWHMARSVKFFRPRHQDVFNINHMRIAHKYASVARIFAAEAWKGMPVSVVH
jgi:hypothetical protein